MWSSARYCDYLGAGCLVRIGSAVIQHCGSDSVWRLGKGRASSSLGGRNAVRQEEVLRTWPPPFSTSPAVLLPELLERAPAGFVALVASHQLAGWSGERGALGCGTALVLRVGGCRLKAVQVEV